MHVGVGPTMVVGSVMVLYGVNPGLLPNQSMMLCDAAR